MFSKTELLTPHLTLVTITPEHVRAFYAGREELSRLLGAHVPACWPVDPIIMEVLKRRMDSTDVFGWTDYIYIHKKDNQVIGDGGFKGPPDSDGRVEIGYAVIPEYRGHGLATEGARVLVDLAFSIPEVKTVFAETVVDGKASMRVLQKLGMHMCGVRHDDGDGDLYCWKILRNEFEENK